MLVTTKFSDTFHDRKTIMARHEKLPAVALEARQDKLLEIADVVIPEKHPDLDIEHVKQREKLLVMEQSKRRELLLDLARKAALRAHCPYSHNRVGSALIADGEIFIGANVEITGYGHTICAERSAITAAFSNGARNITEIAVACIDVPSDASINKHAPCRTCRQWLSDLAPGAVVYINNVQADYTTSSEEWKKSCSRNAFQLEEDTSLAAKSLNSNAISQ